jgi:hypothetical protein
MVSSKDGSTVVQVASYDMAVVDNSLVARQVGTALGSKGFLCLPDLPSALWTTENNYKNKLYWQSRVFSPPSSCASELYAVASPAGADS